jgi:hypothetical protein
MSDPTMAGLTRRYRALLDEIGQLGFIATGSVVERYTECAAPGCRCHTNPSQRHGPYQQYTRKVAGKTVTLRLTAEQAANYREQIANHRRLEKLIADMEEVSAQARELLTPTPQRRRTRPRPA